MSDTLFARCQRKTRRSIERARAIELSKQNRECKKANEVCFFLSHVFDNPKGSKTNVKWQKNELVHRRLFS